MTWYVGIGWLWNRSAVARRALAALTFATLAFAALALVGSGAASAQGPEVVVRPAKPAQAGGRVHTYFIAAEEVQWDYAPAGRDEMMGMAFMDEAKIFIERKEGRVGRVRKKAVYVEYTGADFKTRKPRAKAWEHTGILGPVLRAEVGDTLRVVFKNNAGQPYSMHPHGVFYSKDSEGAPGNDGTTGDDQKDDAVAPGESWTYIWPVRDRSGPGPADGSSLVWLYHSHTDRVKDSNAGLIGAIIVTRKGQARPDGSPKDVDREFITLWKIFDEGKSPYIEEETKAAGGDYKKLEKDPEFKESNKMHAVNGLIFGNVPLMTMTKGERVRWYVIGLGNEEDVHTPHWHGHTVLHEGRRKDVVSLLPAEHIQVDMIPDNVGIWMLHCHVDDHLTAGMSARYQVLPRGDGKGGEGKGADAKAGTNR